MLIYDCSIVVFMLYSDLSLFNQLKKLQSYNMSKFPIPIFYMTLNYWYPIHYTNKTHHRTFTVIVWLKILHYKKDTQKKNFFLFWERLLWYIARRILELNVRWAFWRRATFAWGWWAHCADIWKTVPCKTPKILEFLKYKSNKHV